MAHMLDTTTGSAAFFSYRKAAWHGLGTVVQVPASMEEAQQLARLTFTVEKVPVCASVPEFGGIGEDGKLVQTTSYSPIAAHRAVRRTDTGAILGIVGADWTPVQNDELFAWLRQIAAWGDLTIETAGALGSGETVWVLSRMDSLRWEIDSQDIMRPFLLLSNGFDGKRALTIAPSFERVVCANTMRMAQQEIEGRRKKSGDGLAAGWKLHHTSDISRRMDEARKVLEGTTEAWQATKLEIGRLIDQTFDEGLLAGIIKNVWKGLEDEDSKGEKASKAAETRMANRIGSIRSLLSARTNTTPSAKGTAWGAYNAITEFIDHDNTIRVTGGKDAGEARFVSTQFGRGDTLKAKAWAEVRKTIKNSPVVTVA